MKEQKYLIREANDSPFYLDGWDGKAEWTQERKTAWRLSLANAERRLTQIRIHHQNAQIVKA